MIRCTIELIPFGQEDLKRPIGMIEIANDDSGDRDAGNYKFVIKKNSPYTQILKENSEVIFDNDSVNNEDFVSGSIKNFERQEKNVYDLLKLVMEKYNG